MGQMFSALCRRANVDERVIANLVERKRDFDIDQVVRTMRAAEGELRESIVARAYTKTDVSTPLIPGFSLGYDPGDLIADLVSPVLPGSIERKYPKWARRNTSRILNLQISSDGEIPETGIDVTFPTYAETPYGAKSQVDLNAVAQSADSIDLFEAHMGSIMSDLLLGREKRVADLVMTSGNYLAGCTSALAGFNRWDVGPATSTADPIKDLRITAKTAAAVGVTVNALVASTQVLEYLRTHPKVIAQSGLTAEARVVSDDVLKRVIGVDYIIEGKARYDSAGSAAAATYAWLWGKGCALLKVTPGSGLMQKAFTKTFRHTPLTVRDERDGTRGVRGMTWLIGTHEDAEVVTMSDAGYLLTTCIS